jgi:hypothetical protein
VLVWPQWWWWSAATFRTGIQFFSNMGFSRTPLIDFNVFMVMVLWLVGNRVPVLDVRLLVLRGVVFNRA